MPTPAHDPDAIILEPCRPGDVFLQLFGPPDPLAAAVVAALVAGDPLPDEFTELDTYADCGYPPSWDKCRQVCVAVADAMRLLGLPIRKTHTMLDNIPDADPDYQ